MRFNQIWLGITILNRTDVYTSSLLRINLPTRCDSQYLSAVFCISTPVFRCQTRSCSFRLPWWKEWMHHEARTKAIRYFPNPCNWYCSLPTTCLLRLPRCCHLLAAIGWDWYRIVIVQTPQLRHTNIINQLKLRIYENEINPTQVCKVLDVLKTATGEMLAEFSETNTGSSLFIVLQLWNLTPWKSRSLQEVPIFNQSNITESVRS